MEESKKKSENADATKRGEKPLEHTFLAPGVPIVRTSTPRPLPFLIPTKTELPLAPSGATTQFPTQAPDAPPLPEDPVPVDETPPAQAPAALPHSEAGEVRAEQAAKQVAGEFIWLFEYALDMDPVHLNRPERLHGSAFAYGPALLKGYRLAFEGLDTPTGRVLASLREADDAPEMEVWGMLYRVPRRFTIGENSAASLLDRIHGSSTFVPLEIQVRDPYRQREIFCTTYIATEQARKQVGELPAEKRQPEPAYCKRLLQIARRQKLPASYLRELEQLIPADLPAATSAPTVPPELNTEPLPALLRSRMLRRASGEQGQVNGPDTTSEQREVVRQGDSQVSESRLPTWKTKQQTGEPHPPSAWKAKQRLVEENEPQTRRTDPRLPARVEAPTSPTKAEARDARVTSWRGDQQAKERLDPRDPWAASWQADQQANTRVKKPRPAPWSIPYPAGIERWLMAFGLYISLLFLAVLFLAIFQGLGFWPQLFNAALTPLGVPWYVLLYGLLGGCVSCVISLNRPAPSYPPNFVVVTWFIRPLLGAVLGAFAYLLLSSGAVLLTTQPTQHFALCSIVSALAGLCEGKILLRKSGTNL